MKLHRITSILLHTWYHLLHSMETWVDIFWFSLIDVVIFGLIAIFFARSAGPEQVMVIVLGIILWEVTRVSQYSITVSAMWEIWSRSFSAMFVSPLTLSEFMTGQIISSFLKSLAALVLMAGATYLLYGFSITVLGPMIFVYVLGFFVFASALGFLAFAVILRFGTDVQSLSWSLIFLFQPVSAYLFPADVLPPVVRTIGYLFPFIYLNEAARSQLFTGVIRWDLIGTALVLGLVYFVLFYWIMVRTFKHSQDTGQFVRMQG